MTNSLKLDRRPVLLFVAPYFPPAYYGGVVQVYLGLLCRLKHYRVVVVSDEHGCKYGEMVAWDKRAPLDYCFSVERIEAFEFHLMDSPGAGTMPRRRSRTRELARFIVRGYEQFDEVVRRVKPDVIVSGGTYSAGWLMEMVKGADPFINYLHGEELTMRVSPKFLMPFMRYLQMRSIRKAQLNIAVSAYTAGLVRDLAGAKPEKTNLLPNFVDTSRFRLSGRRPELRAQLGWDDKLIILTLARLEPRKGIDQALKALALLHAKGRLPPNWRYIVGGCGKEHDRLVKLSEQLALTDCVTFMGFIPDSNLAEIYEAADIFLQPNREIDGDTEGFGIVFLEAAACGLPVIGGTAGGTADAIAEGINGYRVDGESLQEIGEAIERLAGDAQLRQRMGLQGAAMVAEDFTAEQAAKRFEKLLDSVLEKYYVSSHLELAKQRTR
jgi:phosphatidylinositol alpha-1,6-mannosyltransferase